MKKKIIYLLAIIISFVISNMSVNACWVYLSVDELFAKANIILIGKVIEKENSNDYSNGMYGVNHWTVEVEYYLKGDIEQKRLIINTPNETTSLHYNLDEWSNEVLLFLNENEYGIEPLSPQGVVSVELSSSIQDNRVNTGKELIEKLNITHLLLQSDEVQQIISKIEEIDKVNDVRASQITKSWIIIGIIIFCCMASIVRIRAKRANVL